MYFSRLFPTHLWEGLDFALRTSVYPSVLHLWVWPLFLLSAAVVTRKGKIHVYLLAAAAGWALHLALDGVLVII